MTTPRNTDRKRRPDGAALGVAAGLAIIAAVIFISTHDMPVAATYARVGPTTLPYVISICLFGLAIWTAVEAWAGDFPEREKQHFGPVLWIVGGLIAQMLTVEPLGFPIATGLLFGATARGFGRKPLWFNVLVGVIISFGVWYLFAKGLQLTLPSGHIWSKLF